MDGKNSYETSWADQWDPEPAYYTHNQKAGRSAGGGSGGAKKKVGEGFTKTKEVAATGMKKVKNGASVGFNWVKDKYHKTTNKH